MAWCTWCIEIKVSTILQNENKIKKKTEHEDYTINKESLLDKGT